MFKTVAAFVLFSIITGCMGPGGVSGLLANPNPPAPPTHAGLPEFNHVFVIIMENRESGDVLGSPSMPYLNSLAQKYATAGQYYAITHPSLPNYLALTGGSTAGVTSDCDDCFVASDNLANQLKAAGHTWKAYMEGMPSPCFLGNQGQYAQRHDPFMYYDNVRKDPAQCNQIVPFTQFATDLSANSLPTFSWISPDVCNDMHDCANSAGDAWLKTWVPQIMASPAWQDRGVLFIVFDEGLTDAGCCGSAAGGKVALVAVSPLAKQGYVSPVAYDHYSFLRTIEDAWQLPLLGNAGKPGTANLADLFATSGAGPAALGSQSTAPTADAAAEEVNGQ